VAWDAVNERVRREQRNREVYVPPISLFRWWARRPHALIGALMDVATETGSKPVISDPFSGGGTVAMEAARRGLSLYAQDLHPWAATGLVTILDGVDPDALEGACDTLLEVLGERCGDLYATTCPVHGDGSTLTHVFWVRSKNCPRCLRPVYLFPYSLVTLASRSKDETDGYLGCPACGSVSRHKLRTSSPRCSSCTRRIPAANTSLLPGRKASCAHHACHETFGAFDGTKPVWTPALVQRLCSGPEGSMSHFDRPTFSEAEVGAAVDAPGSLMEEIAAGLETSLLRRAGFTRWADVFPPRQLRTLLECASAITELDTTDSIRARLRVALCGATEMAGYLSRWDRYYPKAFEAMANHRFAALGLACETNLLGSRGRGTLRRRFDQSISAARWARDNFTIDGAVRIADSSARRRPVGRGALIACGSSERQLPSTNSVDLVLTDPPYFDDVQYAELASLFLVWARTTSLLPDSVSLDLQAEAVANHVRGTGVEDYQALLTGIFSEACRTLKPAGRVLLTYHNTDIRAWWALGRALHDAKLEICALAVADAENASDHPKRGNNGFTSDLVIECRRAKRHPAEPLNVGQATTEEARELCAAGHALARVGELELAEFTEIYRRERGPIKQPRIRIPQPETT
jgi:putative DNA methylase